MPGKAEGGCLAKAPQNVQWRRRCRVTRCPSLPRTVLFSPSGLASSPVSVLCLKMSQMCHQRCVYPQRGVPPESREEGLSHQRSIPGLGGAPEDQIAGYTKCQGQPPQQQDGYFVVREIRGHHTGSRASFPLADIVLEKREVESEKSDRPFYLERMGSTSEHCFKRLHSFGLNPLFFPLCPMDGDLGTNLDQLHRRFTSFPLQHLNCWVCAHFVS